MNLTERLKELRKKHKLTQEDFANKIGISRTYYSNIENGTMPLTNHILEMICFKFEVSKDWLLNGENVEYVKNENFLIEKYSIFKEQLDKLVLEKTSKDDCELIINSFTYFVSTIINYKKINSKDLLKNITHLYDELEKYCFAISVHKPKSTNYEDLYKLKVREEEFKNKINDCISNITTSFTNSTDV